MQPSIVIAVSAVLLLLLFSLFNFIFYCETMAWFHLVEQLISAKQIQCYKNRVLCIQYTHTVLVMKFMSRALYADPRVCVR